MGNKQTAVEWLAEKVGHNSLMSLADYNEILEQALAMEKEQIMDAYRTGYVRHWDDVNSEQYYNETYKK